MFKRISLQKLKNLTQTSKRFNHDLREWFFMIDNKVQLTDTLTPKGLLYLEETEPKIYPNAIKDEKFMVRGSIKTYNWLENVL